MTWHKIGNKPEPMMTKFINMYMCYRATGAPLTHCGLGDFNEILDEYFSSQLQWLMAELPAVKLPLEECH